MSDWISVEDRLPESTKAVLAWVPDNECHYLVNWIGDEWVAWQGERHYWWCDVITHWMPLPEPPEKDNDS